VLLQLKLNEILIVQDFLQILLGVVVKLYDVSCTMVRNSLKKTPSCFCPFLEKNLKSRLIFSFSVDLNILAEFKQCYRFRGWTLLLRWG